MRTAEEEIKKCLAGAKKVVAENIVAEFDKLDYEELANDQAAGRLDMKNKIADTAAPLNDAQSNVTKALVAYRKVLKKAKGSLTSKGGRTRKTLW